MFENDFEICDRFKELRNTLGMKQGDFAKKIKTTQGHVSDIENKRKGVSDRVVEIICLKYNVNEDWLRYGTGEMFQPISKDDEISMLFGKVLKDSDDNFRRRLVKALAKLDEDGWNHLEELIDNISSAK